jgi:polysaccharide deacetylase family protein (PEP-CTERM system associated)
MPNSMKNAMTVDVEDFFQVSAFEKIIDKETWNNIPCRVERNTERILELFDNFGVKATFFTLGWIAERYPNLIQKIVDNGHELASHGYEHIRVINQTPNQFSADVIKTKNLLEDISGKVIKGYRAASYSIGEKNLWALEELLKAGYIYSSSIYPVKHDLYGMPNAPRFAFRPFGDNSILEIPITTLKLFNKKFPIGGGGFFRLYPYRFTRWAFRCVNNGDNQSAVFYFHPWEIDPEQPKQKCIPVKTRIRHYLNLKKTESRLKRLLQDFSWDRMDNVFLGN